MGLLVKTAHDKKNWWNKEIANDAITENHEVIFYFSFLPYIKPFEYRILIKYNIFPIISDLAVIYLEQFQKLTQLLRLIHMKEQAQESPCRIGLK